MRVLGLKLKNFRNYEELAIQITNPVNYFLGPNGSGKTSFIEAIHCCLLGTSFRTTKVENLQRLDSATGYVEMDLEQKGVRQKIRYGFHQNRKSLSLNGKASSALKHASEFPTVLFSPESLALIKAGPQERRDLVDQITVSLRPNARKVFQEFKKALRARNALLRQIVDKPEEKTSLLRVLESLNRPFFELAAQVSFHRLDTLREVNPEHLKMSKKILRNQLLTASIDYRISGQSAIDWDLKQVYDAMVLRYQNLQTAEHSSGLSLVGPHKHEVTFVYNSQDAREFCSQGQQRSLVLALKMAHVLLLKAKRNLYPIVLLDDVFSELDKERRESLFGILGELNAQIFLTNIDDFKEQLFSNADQAIFEVSDGKIIERTNS